MQNNDKQSLIIIAGPTAVGKTALSIELAKSINASIISADSMQVYKHMDIGSAKVTKDEMQGIKHYLIDVLEPEEEFNIATFKQFAKNDIEYIINDGKIPIIAGGTGFYIQALLYDINFDDDANKSDEIRDRLENLITTKGNEFVHNMLRKVDEKAADEIHPNNVKRVIRALEYHYLTGEKISKHNETERIKESPYNFKYFVINEERALLYKNIDKRVDIMIENGLVDEVKALKERGLTKDNISMQGLGYKEILSYLNNDISLEEAVYIIKRDTRHFAKRQLTWFKREKDVIWINKEDFSFDNKKIIEFMKEQLKGAGII
ncbi:MAG: tRNA (adenosine(37)-N6)-dimethylallyltransferase MiaA [Lachnospiraceae bacterium]|nr:tRNA (adenosine(37)-N6)-dimethylallyltransferase MiaA [Lachnospiraceae bacterium]